ncbi:hypothetical protein AAG612_13205 [Citromicrobium bathyomarinum]|uniref:hypothetical protein n=1 Tax=Citromicrobium bathyomarinum TaxID=72174 RepID=UPI003159FD1B
MRFTLGILAAALALDASAATRARTRRFRHPGGEGKSHHPDPPARPTEQAYREIERIAVKDVYREGSG